MAFKRRINTRNIATHGLGDITSLNGYRVAFPEINFFEIFDDTEAVILIKPDSIEFNEDAIGQVKLTFKDVKRKEETGTGSNRSSRAREARWKRRHDTEEQLPQRIHVRTYSVKSDELIGTPTISSSIAIRSIINAPKIGTPLIETFSNDEEELIMMLLAV